MSRSGYGDEGVDWDIIRWRGAVAAGIRGRRGQALLVDMVRALDAMPTKELIANSLECEGGVCALGAVGKRRDVDMTNIDPEDPDKVAATFDIPFSLACEVAFVNDDDGYYKEGPAERWRRVRTWALSQVRPVEDDPS